MKTIRVVAAVIRESDKIFATARGYGEFKGGWEFPGGKIEEGETPQQALVREINEELGADIEVGELIDTIEYDYPEFHLSMDCFWAKVVAGELVLKEAEAAKWLCRNELDTVKWLPADIALIPQINANMLVREMLNRKVSVEKLNEDKINELWGKDIPGTDGKKIKWCYSDVLYSFKSMYLLGIKAYYPNLVEVCGQTLRPVVRTSSRALAYSEEFISSCVDKCGRLNVNCKLQKFILSYKKIGNVISVWPGANVHRGQFGCYDCPDIYFNDMKIKPHALDFFEEVQKVFMNGEQTIIDGKYKDCTVKYLVNMRKSDFEEYIEHAISVINWRDSILND